MSPQAAPLIALVFCCSAGYPDVSHRKDSGRAADTIGRIREIVEGFHKSNVIASGELPKHVKPITKSKS